RAGSRPRQARRESAGARLLAARQVPTITPLALGEQHRGLAPGESFLITRTLENTQPVDKFIAKEWPHLPPLRQTRIRQRLAVALGQLLARMHNAGIFHCDLHPGNLLIHLDDGDQPRLYLIDLQAVRIGAPLGWRSSRNTLVILNRWFILRVQRSERLRFWKAYANARNLIVGPAEKVRQEMLDRARDLELLTKLSNQRFWSSLDRWCQRGNRRFRL